MEKFQLVDVTHNYKTFESFGFSFQEALENSCQALSEILVNEIEKVNCHETLNLDANGSNLEEITEMVLSDLIYSLNENDLIIKEAKTLDFGNNLSGGYFVKMVGHAGSLEETENQKNSQFQISVNPGSIIKNDSGIWKISANLILPTKTEETQVVQQI